MRNLLNRIVATISGLQGLAGVACLAGGAFLLWGVGTALLIVGGFLLLGAWGRR